MLYFRRNIAKWQLKRHFSLGKTRLRRRNAGETSFTRSRRLTERDCPYILASLGMMILVLYTIPFKYK
ncbi:hypothetical protein SAMN05444392_103212 [Seinonella peptonophila]|uniref:Uncharacterized protein n=1 Tax=Seinonella peptonophila TaxID=112248 RepID=A0A1M4WGU9_9BACL|nr:hypothetical protein SAMN05444392_103212 [Seinonella peptonophila]